MDSHNKLHDSPMLPLLLFFSLCLLSLSLLLFSLYKRRFNKAEQQTIKAPLSDIVHNNNNKSPKPHVEKSNPTHLPHSLLLEILPSNSPQWATLFSSGSDPNTSERVDSGGEECGKRKKKKRAKKKRSDLKPKEEEGLKEKQELVCLYPFTSSSSATQRKIKQQYDQLVKSHESNGLTLVQVGQFVNCLIEARDEIQHKSEVVQRKFAITKALLFKADRSSFDRIRQQIYKLELEQKRLEEDAFVYNWLQKQIKLSPAYKKMLEIGAYMELKAKSGELVEEPDPDTELSDISFEDFLAQEKKDSCWQKNGKLRLCSG